MCSRFKMYPHTPTMRAITPIYSFCNTLENWCRHSKLQVLVLSSFSVENLAAATRLGALYLHCAVLINREKMFSLLERQFGLT